VTEEKERLSGLLCLDGAYEGAQILSVVVPRVDEGALAGRAAMPTQVETVESKAGRRQALYDVVIGAAMLAHTMDDYDDATGWRFLGCPGLIIEF
jgi:hypothetical protein